MDRLIEPAEPSKKESTSARTGKRLPSVHQGRARREREHANRLQKLAEASLVINSMHSIEEMLWLITTQAREIIGTHQAVTSIIGDHTPPLNAASFSDKYALWRERDIKLDHIYPLVSGFSRPLRMSRVALAAHSMWPQLSEAREYYPPLSGVLIAPLIGREQGHLGLLLLSDKYKGEFSDEDEAVLTQLAHMAAVAIENAQLYQQAQEAIRGRDRLLSMVSHDLKNPLGAIKGFAQLLRRSLKRVDLEGEAAEELVMGLTRIETTATRMTALINELLDLTRLQLGQPLELDLQPVDFVSLVRQVAAEQQQIIQRHQINVVTALEELVAVVDETRLERVLVNLLSNAIKYDPAGHPITVELTREDTAHGPYCILKVRDQGIGIPAKDLPHIFEQFQRAGNVSARISGSGIGLASAYHVVEQHHGTITVTSEEGKGSTFIVTLPLIAPEP